MLTIKRNKPGDPYTLVLDASALHAKLRELGVRDDGTRFEDRPFSATGSRLIDSAGRLTTEALLRTGVPLTVDLGAHFGRPPSRDQLDALRDVDHLTGLVSTILTHYQPVDIQVSLVFAGRAVP